MTPIISIIIPCYNSGKFLPEALESVNAFDNKDFYEIIIVNDGSTDQFTINLLNDLKEQGYLILNKDNGGPASARNLGVKNASGKYLLLLDSDNKIRTSYLTKGIEVLEADESIAVVHGKPNLFGEDIDENRIFESGPFDLPKMLAFNYIDVCAIVRKTVWDELTGQDEKRELIGFEDWEFWIRVGSSGYKFHFMDEILFDYRVSESSLITEAFKPERRNKVIQYILGKHALLYFDLYGNLFNKNLHYINDKAKPVRSFIKFLVLKYFEKK